MGLLGFGERAAECAHGGQVKESILDGMRRALWMCAWAEWQESGECPAEHKVNLSGVEIDAVCGEPDNQQTASIEDEVQYLVDSLEKSNRSSIEELFGAACYADKVFEPTVELADEFGHYLAMMAQGHGVSWFDDHEEFTLLVPHIDWSWCDLEWP